MFNFEDGNNEDAEDTLADSDAESDAESEKSLSCEETEQLKRNKFQANSVGDTAEDVFKQHRQELEDQFVVGTPYVIGYRDPYAISEQKQKTEFEVGSPDGVHQFRRFSPNNKK